MVKYLDTIITRLQKMSKGINNNNADWTGQPVQAIDVDTEIKNLQKQQQAIDDATDVLKQANKAGRDASPAGNKMVVQVENLANGIYSNNTGKLTEYGVAIRAVGHKHEAPNKGVVSSITDDVDGEGFILDRTTLVNADTYEWEKAAGKDATVLTIDPSLFQHYKTTKKNKFVDDDVLKGVRYFYRERGINANFNGEWSEAVSALQ